VLTSYDGGAAFDPSGKMMTVFQGGGDHFGNFLAAVRSRRHEDLHADIEEGHLSSALCHLGNISYRLGSHVAMAEVTSRLGNRYHAAEDFERFAKHLADNHVPADTTKIQFGEPLTVDAATETIAGNERANAMLSREYREGFVVPGAGKV
jgi:hypothetical protein